MAVKRYNGTSWDTVAGLGAQGAAATSSSITTWVKTATGGETSLTGSSDSSTTLAYTAGQEQLFINGVLQVRGSDYTATNGTSITGLTALVAGDIATVTTVNAFSVTGAVPLSTVTANGDLIVGTSSGAVGRLGIGSTSQVLTVSGGVPTWATPASGSTFVGVSVYGGTLSIPNNTSTAVVFNGENFDTSSFHDNTTNNTRITIPSGKTGYYQVNLASGTFDVTSTGTFYFIIKKNGSDIMETPANKFFSGAYMGQGYSWIFYLTAADYIQLYAYQSSGGAINLYSNQANSNFSFSYLGA